MRWSVLLVVACLAVPVLARTQRGTPASPEQVAALRGKYLVERVALCGDCHTPRDAQGRPIARKALQGAPVEIRPVHAITFAERAPAIAGLPDYTDEQMLTFLQTGRRPDGSMALPPMPAYRLSSADADAIVAYLKDLR